MSQLGQFQFSEILESLAGNTGDIVYPQVGNINILGSGHLTSDGDNATASITFSLDGGIADTYTTDSGDATPDSSVLQILGGDNINTSGATNIVTINLDESIVLPVTSADGLQGLYSLGSNRFMHARGTGNTFLGESAGNLSLTTGSAQYNCGIGYNSLTIITSASQVTALGANAGAALLSGGSSTMVGAFAGALVETGTNLILLGKQAGYAYTTSESSNICIGNQGVITESNKIRIGDYGTGAGQQDTAYIAGIVHASNGLVADDGDISAVSGSLLLPETTSTIGQVIIESIPVLHTYGSNANLWLGSAGNFTFDTTYAEDNVGIGTNALDALVASTTGKGCYNVALGVHSATLLTDSSYCIALGWSAGSLWDGTAGDSNISLGHVGVANDANVLRLGGGTGTGTGQQSKCYISGINGVTVSNTKVVTIDSSTDQLGTIDVPSGIETLAGDTGTATGTTVTIAGGSNITTSATSATVTVDLDSSIVLSGSATANSFITDGITANLTMSGNTITSSGTDTDVDINLVAKGVGGLTFDGIATGWSDSEWHIRQSEVQTSDATETALVTIPLVEGEMITVNATINGFQSDFTDACGSTCTMTCYRPTGGNVTQIGEEILNINSTSTATITADVNVGTQSMVISVIGVAAENWNWISTHQYMFTKTNL